MPTVVGSSKPDGKHYAPWFVIQFMNSLLKVICLGFSGAIKLAVIPKLAIHSKLQSSDLSHVVMYFINVFQNY